MVDRLAAATTFPTRPDLAQIWSWLGEIPDPEIPVISITDLGIVREVHWDDRQPEVCVISITPTYSGCPATEVIAGQIREQLLARGIARIELRTKLSPAWTTDWLSENGRSSLRSYGIAPPGRRAQAIESPLSSLVQIAPAPEPVTCPHCGATQTQSISPFGSTPCKALHRCLVCLEPFDSFKTH